MAKSASYCYYYFPDKSFFGLLNYHNDSSTIPIAFIVKILVLKYRDDIFRYYERRQSQRLQRFDLELDAIFFKCNERRQSQRYVLNIIMYNYMCHMCIAYMHGCIRQLHQAVASFHEVLTMLHKRMCVRATMPARVKQLV